MNIAPLPISSETGWEYGYLTTSGTIATSGADNGMVSPFLPVFQDREYSIMPSYATPSQYSGWLAVVEYNANYSMIDSRKTVNTGTGTIPTTTITPSTNAKYIRVSASNLYNDSAASMSVDYQVTWKMEDDYPVPIQSLQMTTNGFAKPYPASLWRIDESNDGYPYNELMPDVLYHNHIPPPEPDNPERANWLSHWFMRLGDIDMNKTSVMGYISQKADRTFQPANFKNSPHWNNSVQELNDIYYKMLGIDSVGGLIEWNYIEGGET